MQALWPIGIMAALARQALGEDVEGLDGDRRSLRSAPAFGLTAAKMGAGKTLTATIGSYVAAGRAPAMISQADGSGVAGSHHRPT